MPGVDAFAPFGPYLHLAPRAPGAGSSPHLANDNKPCHPPAMTKLSNREGTTQQRDAIAWQHLTDSLPQPEDQDNILWQELNALFRRYDCAATRSRLSYQVLCHLEEDGGACLAVSRRTSVLQHKNCSNKRAPWRGAGAEAPA